MKNRSSLAIALLSMAVVIGLVASLRSQAVPSPGSGAAIPPALQAQPAEPAQAAPVPQPQPGDELAQLVQLLKETRKQKEALERREQELIQRIRTKIAEQRSLLEEVEKLLPREGSQASYSQAVGFAR
jgi:hypothetical protein